MSHKALIIDGYIDEPANLGVPPYISTYPRYIYGALAECNFETTYITIDDFRKNEKPANYVNSFDAVIVISGLTVPGHYIGGTPANVTEVKKIAAMCKNPVSFLAGPIVFGYSLIGGSVSSVDEFSEFDFAINGDAELFIYDYFKKGAVAHSRRDYAFLDEIARLGSGVIMQHPNFPYVICEIETSRGCDRQGFCSFCTEPFYNPIKFRFPKSVIDEVEALYSIGARYFRIGRQANFYAYMGKKYEHGFLKPEPTAVEELLSGVREAAPQLEVLHIDNVNAGTLFNFQKESARVTESIVNHCTEGNIAAMGVESFDPEVIKRNNLNSQPEYVDYAVRHLNDIGGAVRNGQHIFLPGINLLYGLAGESKETYEINYKHLQKYRDEGFLLRRINIRKAMVFAGTPLAAIYSKHKVRIDNLLFKRYKRLIREEIDRPLLAKLFPIGTVLKNVIAEKYENHTTFARQLGTYPILIGIPQEVLLFQKYKVMIVGYGYRSITGLILPLEVNELSRRALQFLPGIGEKRAKHIAETKPRNMNDFLRIVEDSTAKQWYLQNADKFSF